MLNPYPLAICIDDLSVKLNKLRAECCVGNSLMNHVPFAEDLCCLSASLDGLQSIVDSCFEYALESDLVLNSQKSFGVAFLPRKFQLSGVSTLTLNHDQIRFVDSVKYFGIYLSSTLNDNDQWSATFFAQRTGLKLNCFGGPAFKKSKMLKQ